MAFPALRSAPPTLILGLGKTGLACARFLSRQGVTFTIADTRSTPPGLDALLKELPNVTVDLGGFRAETFAVAQRIIVSPGVPLAEPLLQQAIRQGIPVLGDIELFAQVWRSLPEEQRGQIIAVTGSNGKSTVVSLLGAMAQTAGLDAAVGGNFGEPALNLLRPGCPLYVLELSSFQLETTYSLEPAAAVVLNVSPDHMDRYPNMDAYVKAKARIYVGAKTGVVNLDDPLVCSMITPSIRHIGFSLQVPSAEMGGCGVPTATNYGLTEYLGEPWLSCGTTPLLPAAALQLQGRHNVANALAALALGTEVGLPMEAMLKTLHHYCGLPHRTQLVANHDGVRWYNDSKGTNPGATIAALEGLHIGAWGIPTSPTGLAVLIAGGDGKGADFTIMAPVVARTCRAVVLFGRDAPLLEQALTGYINLINAIDLPQAVQQAKRLAQPGDYVLLSPACASFDMFRNYEHRGEVFTNLVQELVS